MKILILCLPGIGDALMATPMIDLLKKRYPKAQIDIACMFEGVRYMFKNNENIHSIFRLSLYKENPFTGLKGILELRKKNYDISILAYPAFRREYHLIQWLIGAKKRISHRYKTGYWNELHFLNTDFIDIDEKKHIVINNLNLLSSLDIDWKKKLKEQNIEYNLNLAAGDVTFGKDFIKKLQWEKETIVGIHPGSINSKLGLMKRWPISRFAELAKKLIKDGKKILIFIGPEEMDLGVELYKVVNNTKACKLITKTTFGQSLGILKHVKFFIGNDNGFAHLSNALKIRSITLFGPTNPLWCAPYNTKITTVIRKASFNPWFRNDMKVSELPKNAQSGMDTIRVKDVLLHFR